MAKLSNRTFGVEFEIMFTDESFERFIEDHHNQIDEENIEDYGYTPTNENAGKIIKDVLPNGWECHEDNTIKGGDVQIEVVTPPLKGAAGIKQVETFLNMIRNYAFVDQSTGLHVHVGAQDYIKNANVLEKLTSALLQYKNVESLFDAIVMQHRKGNNSEYAKSPYSVARILNQYKEVLSGEKNNLAAIVDHLQDSRYSKLNLASLLKHGTFEFRQLHGTLNPELVKNWIIICTAFVDSVKETEQTFSQMLSDIRNINDTEAKATVLTPDKQALVVRAIMEDLYKQILEKKTDTGDANFQTTIEKNNVPKVMKATYDMLINGGRNLRILAGPNGVKYFLFEVDVRNLPAFKEGTSIRGIQSILDHIRDNVPNSAALKNSQFKVANGVLNVAIPVASALSTGRIKDDETLANQFSGEVNKGKEEITGKLPTASFDAIGKQTAASPLREELEALLKLLES